MAYAAVFAVAFLARILTVLTSSGGFRGSFGYDAGVYYAAADALTFGRLPYRDFVLLHPPGIVLAVTPFAAVGRWFGDDIGFTAGNLGFMALGAVNAVLVVLVASRMRVGRGAALAGGLLYACWPGSVGAEYMIRLEPLSNALVLCGLLAYVTARRSGNRWLPVVCGLCFGAAASVKIWWSVPLLVMLAWHLAAGRRRDLGRVAAGAGAALLAVNGPFFLAAPAQMWHMVVTEQLGRPRSLPLRTELGELTGILQAFPHLGPTAATVLPVVVVVLVLLTLATAWRVPAARLVVVLTAAQLTVLVLSPSWFASYADYLAPAVSLSLAAAASRFGSRAVRPARAGAWLSVAACAVLTGLVVTAVPNDAVTAFPGTRLAPAVRGVRCVMSDAPMGLIMVDALSRDLGNGCPNWVDVTGRTYGVDAERLPDGMPVPRTENGRWQRDLLGYLGSGDAVLFVRNATGVSRATRAALRGGGVLAEAQGHAVYRTRAPTLSSDEP